MPEQERDEIMEGTKEIAEGILRDYELHGDYAGPHLMAFARAYLALLAAYEDRSAAFERAAADCDALLKAAQAYIDMHKPVEKDERGVAVFDFRPQQDAYKKLVALVEALAATPKPVIEEESADD